MAKIDNLDIYVGANSGGGTQGGGAFGLSSVLSPAQITSNQDNYSPTGLSTANALRLNTDASRNITGITGGASGRMLVIENVGSFNIVLKNDVTSTAANRFLMDADLTLEAGQGCLLWYDTTSTRWRLASKTISASAPAGGDLTLVEHKLITASTQTVTFSGLDGNTDGGYQLRMKIWSAATGPTYGLKPNGSASNLQGHLQYMSHSGGGGVISSTSYLPFGFSGTSKFCSVTINIHARKNPHSINTPFMMDGCGYAEGSSSVYYTIVMGGHQSEYTNLTSIDLTGDLANCYTDGTEMWLYSLGQ